jgi:hypothetical protein
MRDELWPASLAMLTLPPGGTNVRLTHDHHGNQVAAAGTDLLFTLSEGTLYAWKRDEAAPTGWCSDGTWQEPVTLPNIRRIQKDHPQMRGTAE